MSCGTVSLVCKDYRIWYMVIRLRVRRVYHFRYLRAVNCARRVVDAERQILKLYRLGKDMTAGRKGQRTISKGPMNEGAGSQWFPPVKFTGEQSAEGP